MKDTVIIEGKEYISSSRAAEIARYTNDYIGQLCRRGKLTSRMVGRIRLVEKASLEAYMSLVEQEKLSKNAVASEIAKEVHAKSRSVDSITPRNPVVTGSSMVRPAILSPYTPYPSTAWTITYEDEDKPFLPPLRKKIPAQVPAISLPADKKEIVPRTSLAVTTARDAVVAKRKQMDLVFSRIAQGTAALGIALAVVGSSVLSAYSIMRPAEVVKTVASEFNTSKNIFSGVTGQLASVFTETVKFTLNETATQSAAVSDSVALSITGTTKWLDDTTENVIAFIKNIFRSNEDKVDSGIATTPSTAGAVSESGNTYITYNNSTTTTPAPSRTVYVNQTIESSSVLDERVTALEAYVENYIALQTQKNWAIYESIAKASQHGSRGGGTGTGSVTSVQVSGGSTGLSFSGGPITSSGTVVLGGTLDETSGGTGIVTYQAGDILYASAADTLSKLAIGSSGQVLKVSGGVPVWGVDNSGGGTGLFSTTTNNLALYPTTASQVLVVGGSATTTTGNLFEVIGNSKLGGNVVISGNVVTSYISATSTTATSSFANGINLTSGCYSINGTCIGSGSGSGIVNVGNQYELAYYDADGNVVSGASSLIFDGATFGINVPSGVTISDVSETALTISNTLGRGIEVAGLGDVLSVAGINSSANAIRATSGTFSAYLAAGDSNLAGYFSNSANNTLVTLANSTEAMRVSGGNALFLNGKVGIGTTSPYRTLSVQGNGIVAGDLTVTNLIATGTATIGGVLTAQSVTALDTVTGYNGSFSNAISVNGTIQQFYSLYPNQERAEFVWGSGGEYTLRTLHNGGSAHNLRFTPDGGSSIFDGNVGIGTTSPTQKLTVDGNILAMGILGTSTLNIGANDRSAISINSGGNVTVNSNTNGNAIFSLQSLGGGSYLDLTANGTAGSYIGFHSTNYPYWHISRDANTNNDLTFYRQPASSGYTDVAALTLGLETGNVGIGTTSPYAKLSVAGQVVGEYFTATSTTATSSFAGGLNVGNGGLVYDFTTGVTSIAALETGSMNFDVDAGQVSWVDLPISAAPANTVESYSAQIGGTPIFTVYGQSNGSGGAQNLRVAVGTTSPVSRFTVWGEGTGAGRMFELVNNASTTVASVLDNGTAYFRGNVGIGSTSPSAQLTVAGQVLSDYFTATSTTATSTLAGGLSAASSTFTVLNQNGYVGIGTTKPTSPIEIALPGGGINLSNWGTYQINGGAGNNGGVSLSYTGLQASNSGGDFGIANTGVGGTVLAGGYDTSSHLTLRSNSHVSTGVADYINFALGSTAAPIEAMRIQNNSGVFNVGIGTTSPYAKLSVVGRVVAESFYATSTTATSTFAGAFSVGSTSPSGQTMFVVGTTTPNLTVNRYSGNVGIGTMDSQMTFDVGGYNNAIYPGINVGIKANTNGFGGMEIYNAGGTNAWSSIYLMNNVSGGTGSLLLGHGSTFNNGTTFGLNNFSTGIVSATTNLALYTAGSGPVVLATNSVERMRITQSGNVGIGTTSPYTKFAVVGNVAAESFLATSTIATSTISGVFSIGTSTPTPQGIFTVGTTTPNLLVNRYSGNIGIASSSPWRSLSVTGTVAFDGLTASIGAGSICLSSTKQLVYNSASDACLSSLRDTKHDITDLSVDALSQIRSLNPVSFVYNDSDGRVRYGFIAEEAAAVDPHLATYNAMSALTGIDDRAILAVTIDAVQELDRRISAVASSTPQSSVVIENSGNGISTSTLFAFIASTTDEMFTTSTQSTTTPFMSKVVSSVFEYILSIKEWTVEKIAAADGFFGKIFADRVETKELCVEDICVTKDQFKTMVLQAAQAVSTTTEEVNDSNESDSDDSTDEVIEEGVTSDAAATSTPETAVSDSNPENTTEASSDTSAPTVEADNTKPPVDQTESSPGAVTSEESPVESVEEASPGADQTDSGTGEVEGTVHTEGETN